MTKLESRDFVFSMKVLQRGLDESKETPLCDMCSEPFHLAAGHGEPDFYVLNGVIINRFLWGVLCDPCREKSVRNGMRFISEAEAPEEAKRTLLRELGVPVSIVWLDGLEVSK